MTVSVKTPTQQNGGSLISPGIMTCVGDGNATSGEKSGLTCRSPFLMCCEGCWWKGIGSGALGCVNEAGNPDKLEPLAWRCKGACWPGMLGGILTLRDWT